MINANAQITTARHEDRRKEARYMLVLRAGVLKQKGRTSFCMVKNISTTGVQLKTYAAPVLHAKATLSVADEQPVSGRIAWIKGDTAGISLDRELNSETLLRVQQKLRPDKRRSIPQIDVQASAQLRTGARICAQPCSTSRALELACGQIRSFTCVDRVLVEFADLPSISAHVRWVDDGEIGLAFDTPVPIIIAQWMEGRIACSGS